MNVPNTIKAVLFLILISVSSIALADLAGGSFATQKLLEIFPGSIEHSSKNTQEILDFCPDNTCIEFKKKQGSDIEKWSLIYLYYLGDYYALQRWRTIQGVKAEIDELIKALQLGKCLNTGKADQICLMGQIVANGMKIYHAKYDEGGRFAERVSPSRMR